MDIDKSIKPIAHAMITESAVEHANVTDSTSILDSKVSGLKAAIKALKDKYLKRILPYDKIATSFVQGVADESGEILRKELVKTFSVSRANLLAMEDIKKPLDAHIKTNVSLIVDVSDKYLSQVENVIHDNFTTNPKDGDGISFIDKIIDERNSVSKVRAGVIARDQLGKTTEAFNAARYKSYGITSYIWTVADVSNRTRAQHLKNNGKEYLYSEGAPSASGGLIHPADEVLCRCTALPVIPKDLFN